MRHSESTPVLLVGDAWHSVLAAARALRSANYTPWLAADESGTYASRSRATAGTVLVPDPRVDGDGFVREVAAAAARFSVAAVLPTAESHLLGLAGREAEFAGIALGAPARQTVERATDKRLLPELAAAAGLRTPPTAKVVCGDLAPARTIGFPAIVKPPRKSGIQNAHGKVQSSAAHYVATEQALEEMLATFPGGEGIVQPYIPGQLVSVAGVVWKGELVCAMHQASIRIWPPDCGVSAYAETIPPNAELEQGVGGLLQELGWSGVFQTQFIRSPLGQHYLIDLNPRVYGSLALAVASGLNLPGIWADLLLDRRPKIGTYRVGVRFREEEKDVRALVQLLMDGERRRALRGFMPRRNTTHAIFALRDPIPLLATATKVAARLGRLARQGVSARDPNAHDPL